MKKFLLNVVGVLILSICVLSCSKNKDKEDIIPASKEDIVGQWIISEPPLIEIAIMGSGEYQKKINDTLTYLFKKNDKYLFKANDSCKVTRNRTVDHPNRYKIEGGSIVFDGYIKFQTNISDDKLTLTAGDAEIQGIVKKRLPDIFKEIDESTMNILIKAASGKLKLVLIKQDEE
jgi:hypothetical protein